MEHDDDPAVYVNCDGCDRLLFEGEVMPYTDWAGFERMLCDECTNTAEIER